MILLVDDDPTSLRMLEMTLRKENQQVISARTADEALEVLRREEVALVITDCRMPGMSGLEFLQVVRDDPRLRDTPVVMCTGAADLNTVHEAMRHGVRDYIVKPIRRDVVAAKVRTILRRSEPILEPRFDAMPRLGVSEAEYLVLARTTLDHVEGLLRELSAARTAGDAAAAVHVAEQAGEPAELLGGTCLALAVAQLRSSPSDLARDRTLGVVAEELVAFCGALRRATRPLV